jgi:hypothetical protein
MRALLSFLGAAALVIAAGCGGNVILGGEGGGTPGGGGSGGSPGPGGGTSPTGGSVSGNAVVVQEGGVELRFASQSITCQSPDPGVSGCSWWKITIPLPDPSMLTPGLIDIEAAGIDIFIQEATDPFSPDPNDCGSAVGGGALPATLVIHSVNDAQAVVELQGFDGYFLEGKADGVYTAPVCF